MNFALITEGVSEHRIIKHIIAKFFKDQDPVINQIQPKLLNNKQETGGGWNEVLKYCEREELRDILIENDYLIIQIDTDQSAIKPFNISHSKQEGVAKTYDELHAEVKAKLLSLIKPSIIESFENRIIFAISIHTIECWLLPIYYSDTHKTDTRNCINILNSKLRSKNLPVVPLRGKNNFNGIAAYENILRNWRKTEDIITNSKHNIGFREFIEKLDEIYK